MENINRYFEILGLKLGASLEEVKEAYKDLVKVWHPDRYEHDPKLQAKVQEKLKEINGEEGIKKLLDELIKKELLYQEAKKKGLDKDPAYQKKVADSQKLILLSSLLEKEIEDEAKVSDKEVRDFYDKNKTDFTEKGGKVIEFEKIKEMLAQRMTAQKQKEVFDSYVENLKKSYVIEINEKAIKTLRKNN